MMVSRDAGTRLRLSEQTEIFRALDRSTPGFDAELAVDAVQMRLERAHGHVEFCCNLTVVQARGR